MGGAKVGRVGARAWPDAAVYERVKKTLEDFRAELRGQRLECFQAGAEGSAPAGER